ncbi:MAG: Asp-tRNA(Asn)/Glu-tRNA(Gln) amidotransferase GatCAB subunit B, partial [Rhodobacteraceae bacterium]|nr:Asp-tRNA(Asn)/Glu-tRNA(Gln) amidotransferase GatCAB subunit B [Paracoccaceae bacterium]
SKEEAHDYRYFPCPDLLPLDIEQAWVDDIAASMPELPDEKKARFVADYGMTEYDANVLTAEVENAAFFEDVAKGRDGKQAANWVINELFGRLNKEGLAIAESPLSAAQLGGILDLMAKGDISGKMAKDLFEILWTEETGADPAAVAAARGMQQVTDTGAIEAAVDEVIAANPAQVEKARANPKLAGWFVGQVLKATGGKANPATVNDLVARKLGL